MIVVSVDRAEKTVVQTDQPQIEHLVSRQVSGNVRAFITGQPSLDRALKDASLTNLRRTELIAIGILFLLLLIGLRAPIAALIVAAVGALSMLSGFGEVALLGHVMKLDPVGVALGSMTGLALGVGFALLILDRFHREELPEGKHPRDAVTAATRELETTGKAVLVGGTAVVLALALVAVIGPTELVVSLGTGMLACAAFATGGAVVVMVAALIPFATTELINVRQFGIGVAVAILLEVLVVRPVLLPAAEAVLGRFGWWPTSARGPSEPTASGETTERLARPRLSHRRPRPAHQ
jgi:RND superfamily putative drug exporter